MSSRTRKNSASYDAESLLEISAKVFTARGFDRTSMEDLSKELGITKSSIYHHVPSKDALLGLALDRALDGIHEVLDRVEGLDAPAIDKLELLIHDSVLLVANQLPYVTLFLRVRGNTKVERQALAERRAVNKVVTDLVRAAMDEGDISTDANAAVTARLLFGLVNSLAEWYQPRRDGKGEAVAKAVVDLAFRGILVRETPSAAAGTD